MSLRRRASSCRIPTRATGSRSQPQESVGVVDIARTVFRYYPKRTVLGLSLFIGQAFLYNAVFFTFALVLTKFYKVDSSRSGLPHPVRGGQLPRPAPARPPFRHHRAAADDRGHLHPVRRAAGDHRYAFDAGALTATTQTMRGWSIFFFASAAASAAYLTVSEIFPMETRAIAIALFYAVGTGLGGIIGPVLFGHLIATKQPFDIAMGYLLGGGLMFAAGVVEIFLGIDAEQKSLEEIASPLTAADSDDAAPAGDKTKAAPPPLPRSARPYPFPAQSGRFGRYDLRPGSTALRETSRAVSEREIDAVVEALRDDGPASMSALAARVGARYWVRAGYARLCARRRPEVG